jgi:hypothetical protein
MIEKSRQLTEGMDVDLDEELIPTSKIDKKHLN